MNKWQRQWRFGLRLGLALSTAVGLLYLVWSGSLAAQAQARVLAELTTAYHQIQVYEQNGVRVLSFDGSMESRMSVDDPAKGHFEYTEYFHMPWLWNTNMSRVLMIGLGGGSTQRAYARHYPDVTVETVELDSTVRTLARQYFHFEESARQKVFIGDGRMFLRRARASYGAIIVDAYAHNRYGSYLPQHLVTKEFFELAHERLEPDGVLCYNVMGAVRGPDSDLVAAVHRTLDAVFPHVYLFPAVESENVVLLAAKSDRKLTFNQIYQRAAVLDKLGRLRMPKFRDRIYQVKTQPPYAMTRAQVLTDDFAPLHRLLGRQELSGQGGKEAAESVD